MDAKGSPGTGSHFWSERLSQEAMAQLIERGGDAPGKVAIFEGSGEALGRYPPQGRPGLIDREGDVRVGQEVFCPFGAAP
jgi:hypothetical protein